MIKLYGVPTSPYVRHARVALATSGLAWQLEGVTPESIDKSPMKRVPFIEDGDLMLTDSAVIVRYVRERAGQPFLKTVLDHELFALSSSVLDTGINVFLMNIADSAELAEVSSDSDLASFSPRRYFERQYERIGSGINGLNDFELASGQPYTDGEIRLACLLDWGLFREIINIDDLQNLQSFLEGIRAWAPFAETAPDL